ncbi:MAG TPA: FecR domain-containing protein [Sphingomicrobium sp.]|nr:FecR domain-containing protein [Sphingomicrobium sp.]
MTQNVDRREAALDWLVRTNDPDFDAWDEFTAWLEADPTNADAYHALVESEERMRPFVEAMPVVDVVVPERKRPRLAIAAGIAALAAAATAIVAPRMMAVEYSTGPGEVRIVSLGGQDKLVMNGSTRLELAGFDRRTVRLAQGQVLLRLNDPGQDKIELLSGDLKLVDVGTVFEVARDGQDTRVVVSEGAVVADPGGAGLKLMPGQRLDTTDGAAVLQAGPADISSVGSFERGQLSYVDEPLGNVVADLRRSTGIDISASTAISARRFSGTLSVAEVKRDPNSLAPLLGVSVERSGQGWKLGGKV